MARTARFGQVGLGRPDFTFVYDARALIRLAERVDGHFRAPGGTFQRATEEAHEDMAIKVADGMVDELRRKVAIGGKYGPRPQGVRADDEPGGRLAFSLRHEHNRETTASSFRVGLDDWLERSPAREYYRQIEVGNPKTYLWPALFTNDFTQFYGPTPQPESPHARMPQGSRRSPSFYVGPWRPYYYSRGGDKAYERLSVFNVYKAHLQPRGLNLDSYLR